MNADDTNLVIAHTSRGAEALAKKACSLFAIRAVGVRRHQRRRARVRQASKRLRKISMDTTVRVTRAGIAVFPAAVRVDFWT